MNKVFLLLISKQITESFGSWLIENFHDWVFFDTMNMDEILPFPGKGKSVAVITGRKFNPEESKTASELLKIASNAGFIRILICDSNSPEFPDGLFEIKLSTALPEEVIQRIIGEVSGLNDVQQAVLSTKTENDDDDIKLWQLIENFPNPVVFTNTEGNVVYANNRISEITGYSPEEYSGRVINLLNPENNNQENLKNILNTLSKGDTWQGEFHNFKKNGQRYWERSFITPLKNKSGRITHFAYIIEDISKRQHIEKVLVEAKETAEESNKLKTAFLTNMSHEIRIPMNAIIGFTEMLTEKDYSEEEKSKFIELVLENSRKLLSTLDDVIDIAKIEAGQMNISTQRCSANKILFDNLYIFRQMSEKLGKSHLTFRAQQYIPDQNLLFISDPQRINQVISNLMSNALKYTQEGSIDLGYRLTNFHESQFLEFYVNDTGMGIPAHQVEKIFNSYKQIESNERNGYGGSGLGLAISRNIARLMGGDIILESETGKGSTFRFLIPFYEIKPELIPTTESETKKDDKTDWSHKQVLIAEDEDSNFKLLEIMLRRSNVRISRAFNGKQAVDYVNSGRPVDLILMDVKMPVMDGYEATIRIKDINPQIPIVVQTAFALAGDRELSLDAGCDEYLSKPIKATELYNILKKYLD